MGNSFSNKTLRFHSGRVIQIKLFLFVLLSMITYLYLISNGVINGDNGGPSIFHLSRFNGALILQYQKTVEEEYILSSLNQRYDRDYLEGGIQLDLDGSIYHPNLVTFHVGLNLIAGKSKDIVFSDAIVNNSLRNTYDINLTFLKRKQTSFQLYAQRNFGSADRRFRERYYQFTNRYGLKLTSSNKILPFRLDISRNTMLSESLAYLERDETTEQIDLKIDTSRGTGSKSMIRLRLNDYHEKIFDMNYRTVHAQMNYLNGYGNGNRNRLSGLLSYRSMMGDLDQNVLKLMISHRQYVRNNIFLLNTYNYLIDKSEGRSLDSNNLELSLNHELFRSLFSKMSVIGRSENREYQKLLAYQVGPEFNYRKTIPGGTINFSYAYQLEDGKYSSKNAISYTSELHKFTISDSLLLTVPGINSDSIRITNDQLTLLYLEGIDYQLDVIGTSISVFRIPGGSIPARGAIRISYDFLAFPDYNFSRAFQNFNFNLNVFRYIHLFYRSDQSDHEITSEYLIAPYQDYTRRVIGGKVTAKLIEGEYFIEDYDSDIATYTSKNLRATLGYNFSRKLRISGNISRNRLEYDNGDHFVHFDSYYASLNFKPSPRFNLNMIFRDMSYKTPNYSRGRESLIGRVHWTFRKISLEMFYEYILNAYGDTEKKRNHLALRIRRMF